MDPSVITSTRPLRVVEIDPCYGQPLNGRRCRFFGKVSRVSLTSPGSTEDWTPGFPPGIMPPFHDDEYIEKVAHLANAGSIKIYADCDHSGRLVQVSDISCSCVLNDGIWLDRDSPASEQVITCDDMNRQRVVVVHGDGIISPRFIHPKHLFAGGRDCLMIGAISQESDSLKRNRNGVMHGSVGNLFGYKHPNFLGPLLDRFLENFDPTATQLFIGPSIRACCYRWKTIDGEILRDDYIRRHYPTIKLDHMLLPSAQSDEKCHVDLMLVIRQILALHGYDWSRIWCSDICTYCNSDYHSQRRDGDVAIHRPRNLVIVSQ
jgi:hypothetical protein